MHVDLEGPPVTIIHGQIDLLRSEGELLTDTLGEADVPAEYQVCDGVTHGFFGMAAAVGDAKKKASEKS